MIIYKDILQKLKAAGYTTTRIRQEKILPESVLTRIRHNRPITTETIDKICELTNLPIAEIMEYKREP